MRLLESRFGATFSCNGFQFNQTAMSTPHAYPPNPTTLCAAHIVPKLSGQEAGLIASDADRRLYGPLTDDSEVLLGGRSRIYVRVMGHIDWEQITAQGPNKASELEDECLTRLL